MKIEDWRDEVTRQVLYTITVFSGCAIQTLVVIPLIFLVATRKNPYMFAYGGCTALVTAFGTASRYWVTVKYYNN